ncbi:MAG TPA: hypothetical protein VIR79_03355 [Nitrospira sp.]
MAARGVVHAVRVYPLECFWQETAPMEPLGCEQSLVPPFGGPPDCAHLERAVAPHLCHRGREPRLIRLTASHPITQHQADTFPFGFCINNHFLGRRGELI